MSANPYASPLSISRPERTASVWPVVHVFLASGCTIALCFVVSQLPFPYGLWQTLTLLSVAYVLKIFLTYFARRRPAVGTILLVALASATPLTSLRLLRTPISYEDARKVLTELVVGGVVLLAVPIVTAKRDIRREQSPRKIEICRRKC